MLGKSGVEDEQSVDGSFRGEATVDTGFLLQSILDLNNRVTGIVPRPPVAPLSGDGEGSSSVIGVVLAVL